MLEGEAKIIEVELKGPVSSLRRAVLQSIDTDKAVGTGKRAIMVFGFEHLVPSEGPAPVLDELNQSRDLFPEDIASPFLIWLPDYALTRLAKEAPDFWGWRSGVFEFSPDLKLISNVEMMAAQGAETSSLGLAEKRERASALEGLIRAYQELQRGKRENRAHAAVLQKLGDLRFQIGEYDLAQQLYQESLKIEQELGDKNGVAITMHQMGNLAYANGNLDEARKLYQESLKIKQELGNKNGIAATLHQMGMMAQDTGDLDEARKLYQESIKIKQELGNKNGMAFSLAQLALLDEMKGDIKTALKLTSQAEAIFEEIGPPHYAKKASKQRKRLEGNA
jgi:tetratricopeptide (TPR) repeat protein